MPHEQHASSPPPERESIERFVRVTLGCKCPDEVFRSVAIDRIGADEDRTAHTRLVVGDRLLIYVKAADDGRPASGVAALARTGIAERDALGLNRFRLVIAGFGPPGAADDARAAFAATAGTNERAHLHFIDESELPRALRSG